MGSWRCGSAALAAAIVGWLAAAGQANAAPACGVSGRSAEVAAVLDGLELALDDGRVLRLAGLDPARATAGRPRLADDAKSALERWIGGRRVLVEAVDAAPDRWDRTAALVVGDDAASTAAGASPGMSFNEALVGAGWARVRPDEASSRCMPALLAAEAKARAGGLGLWADPYYSIVSAEDTDGLSGRAGAMAIVEGVMRLRHDRTRTIVWLTPAGRRGLMVIVGRPAEKRLAKAGLDLQKLVGRAVRIRGFLDDRFGPRIDLASAGQIEVVGQSGDGSDAALTPGVGAPVQKR